MWLLICSLSPRMILQILLIPIQTHHPPQHTTLDCHRCHGIIITIINNIINHLDLNPDHSPIQRIEYLHITCTTLRRLLWIKQHSPILIRIWQTFQGLVNITCTLILILTLVFITITPRPPPSLPPSPCLSIFRFGRMFPE